jgi:hypothetical protein
MPLEVRPVGLQPERNVLRVFVVKVADSRFRDGLFDEFPSDGESACNAGKLEPSGYFARKHLPDRSDSRLGSVVR